MFLYIKCSLILKEDAKDADLMWNLQLYTFHHAVIYKTLVIASGRGAHTTYRLKQLVD